MTRSSCIKSRTPTVVDWRDKVKDNKAKIAIDRRIYRAELGNFGHQGQLLIALRVMTKAFGCVSEAAQKARLNGTHIYRKLPATGNPEIRSVLAILKTMGLRLAVLPIQQPAAFA